MTRPTSSNPVLVTYGGGAVGGGGGSRTRPGGRVALPGGPAPAMNPFPVQGRSSLFVFLQVVFHCWDSHADVTEYRVKR